MQKLEMPHEMFFGVPCRLISLPYPASLNVLARIAQTLVTNIVLNIPLTCSLSQPDASYAIPKSMISVRMNKWVNCHSQLILILCLRLLCPPVISHRDKSQIFELVSPSLIHPPHTRTSGSYRHCHPFHGIPCRRHCICTSVCIDHDG